MIRPYVTETELLQGTGVVQGAADNKVRCPDADGSGDFIGVFAYGPRIAAKAAGESVGIALSGVVKARAGASVTAGKKAVLKADASGAFINLPESAGAYQICGLFLQSGEADEFVEMIVERASVTIAAIEE